MLSVLQSSQVRTTAYYDPQQSTASQNTPKQHTTAREKIKNNPKWSTINPKHSKTTPNNLLLQIVFINENHVSQRFDWFHDAVKFNFWNDKTFPKSGAFLISTKKAYLESIHSQVILSIWKNFFILMACSFVLVFILLFFVLICLFLKQLYWKSMVSIRTIFLSFRIINCVGLYIGYTLFFW